MIRKLKRMLFEIIFKLYDLLLIFHEKKMSYKTLMKFLNGFIKISLKFYKTIYIINLFIVESLFVQKKQK